MAFNCYDFTLPLEVCVDGPVGDGQTANMSLRIDSPSSINIASAGEIGSESNWDGSTVQFNDWHFNTIGGCSDITITVSVTLFGPNQVLVAVEGVFDDCPSGTVYSQCGDGPHAFSDSRIVPMTGSPCSSL